MEEEKAGKVVKKVVSKAIMMVIPIFIKILVILSIFIALGSIISWFISILKSTETPEQIYEQLNIENLIDLVEISGDSSSGYYLQFKDEKKENIEKLTEFLKNSRGVEYIDGTSEVTAEELLKKMIQADLITRLPNLGANLDNNTDIDKFQGLVNLIRTEAGDVKSNTASVDNTEEDDENIGASETENESAKYTVAIMKGYTKDEIDGMTKEEKKNLNKVIKNLRDMLSGHNDIKIITIDGTSDEENLEIAKEKNANIFIGIRFEKREDESKNIVNIYHGDNSSNNIDILSKRIKNKVSESMNVSKGETITSENKINKLIGNAETKNNSAKELVSIVVESGYLSSDDTKSIKKQAKNYATGLVDGIIKYLNETQDANIDDKGYNEVVTESTTSYQELENSSTQLKYMPLDEFNNLVENNNKDVLNYFTMILDDDKKGDTDENDEADENKEKSKKRRDNSSWKILFVKSWNQDEAGNITIQKPEETDGLDLTTVLQKYYMPLEYLFDYKIAFANEKFINALADLAIDSKYTIALLDNTVTTTTTVSTTTYTYLENDEQTIQNPSASSSSNTTTTIDTTTSMELVNADSWCVTMDKEIKLSKEINTTSYEDASSSNSEKISQEDLDDLDNLEGKLDENTLNWLKDEKKDKKSWEDKTDTSTNGEANIYSKTTTTTTVTTENITYTTEKATPTKEGEKFSDIYEEYNVDVTLMKDRLLTLLEQNDSTSEMIELTKYLLYQATGDETYKVDYDFSEYDVSDFNDASTGTYGGKDCTATGIASGVEALREKILKELKQQGIEEYIDVILALVMQESGGSSSRSDYATDYDVFQSSESKGLPVGTLNTEESIKQGVKHFKECLKLANKDLDLTLQSYNFGTGFASFALERGGFSQDAVDAYAKKYSNGQTREEPKASQMGKWAYGDQYYVEHVKRYLKISVTSTDITGTSEEKLARLFPKGLPNSQSEMSKYLSTIKIDITTKQGNKSTQRLTVHKDLAQDVKNIFKEIQKGGFKVYEAGAYSWREMNNGGTSRSHHSYGVAIDINVNENYSHRGSTVYAGSFWDPKKSEYSIAKDGIVVKAFKARGWSWGGNWSGNYQDYMHFSFTGH